MLLFCHLLAARLASLCHGIDDASHPALLMARSVPAFVAKATPHIGPVLDRAARLLEDRPADRRPARIPTVQEILDGTAPLTGTTARCADDAAVPVPAGAVILPFRRRA